MPLDFVIWAILAWLLIGTLGLMALRHLTLVARVLFPAGALVGLCLFGAAALALNDAPQTLILPLGLPGLPFHCRLDALSAFFLMLIGACSAGISLFAGGYFRQGEGTPPGLLCFEFHLFLASMALVVIADDAYAFMVFWECMALSSYFLVIANHRLAEIRRAGYLYLLMAHVGAVGILLCFGVLKAHTGDYTFQNLRAQQLPPEAASLGFLLALFGFGTKAGLVPLHIWLPEAHPAAPSPVSALMSGVMLKTALYGLLRITFDVLHQPQWWWGVVLLGLGLATALFGVVYAAVQVDMKRLLAYSSIENMGLLLAGTGLAALFSAYHMAPMAALAMGAVLYHAFSHACFKSLLFLATGSVLHATHERSLGKLGGLIRTMPWVAWLTLIGALTSAGLPPLGGFVSEWLLLQSFLFTPGLPNSFLNMLVPVLAAVIALVAALAGYTMVKFYGVIFLGQPREEKLAQAKDAGLLERLGMLWLVAGCLGLGLFPAPLLAFTRNTLRLLTGTTLAPSSGQGFWLLIPVAQQSASYGPIIFLLGVVGCSLLAFVLVRWLYHGQLRRADPWDCGFAAQTARMQDTAEGFGQPIRQIFEPFFTLERTLPSAFDQSPHYQVRIVDPFWQWLYQPVVHVLNFCSRAVGHLQQGRIARYLLYSFLTLIAVLLLVKR